MAPAVKLDKTEYAKLATTVRDGQENIFLVPVADYPNMDGDQYTPLRAYLQSVVDYLEWLKASSKL